MSFEYLRFYETLPQACAYLPTRENIAVVTDPALPLSTEQYGLLIDHGFRRSGGYFYRPHCRSCRSCVSVRIPVQRFRPRRGQRRVWLRNQDLTAAVEPLRFQDEHWALYRHYQHTRHTGEDMDSGDVADYHRFILNSPVDTRLVSFRLGERLLAVAAVDFLPQGLSAVYTFYDPQEKARALGVHAVLWQIEQARMLGLPYVYLGYWIAESPKMAYKIDYQPLEGWVAGEWLEMVKPE